MDTPVVCKKSPTIVVMFLFSYVIVPSSLR